MKTIYQKIKEYGVMPLVTLERAEHARTLGLALQKSFLPIAEVTFRTKAAANAIKILTQEFPDILVGAGTVLDIDTAQMAIEAGAKFILSPGINEEIVKYCQERNVVVIPGCMTPSDLDLANSLGVEIVKIFPMAEVGGLPMLRAISAPFPNMRFVATGGINDANLAEYLSFERIISCGGSWMIDKEMLESHNVDMLSQRIDNSLAKMLKLRFVHLGINPLESTLQEYESLLNAPGISTGKSYFVSDEVEIMCEPGRGANGHIAIGCSDVVRTMAYYERKGIKIDENSIQKDEKGEVFMVYLKDEMGGFAVHLIRK